MNVSEDCWFPVYRPSCGSFAASVGSALCEPPWPGRTIWSSGRLRAGGPGAMGSAATTASAVTDFGHGKPITLQDLAGKTFCWYDGGRVTYGANGMETNHKNNHHPPWPVPKPGVLKYWGRKYTQVELQPDGRLHFYKYCLICR